MSHERFYILDACRCSRIRVSTGGCSCGDKDEAVARIRQHAADNFDEVPFDMQSRGDIPVRQGEQVLILDGKVA